MVFSDIYGWHFPEDAKRSECWAQVPAEKALASLAAEFAAVRRETREECAKEIDGLAFCEECHDCYDDLVRSAPYRRAAKYLRDNAAIRAMNEEGVIAAVKPKPRYEAVANAVWDTKENRAVHKDELIALLNEKERKP
jgi:hypothetical protein